MPKVLRLTDKNPQNRVNQVFTSGNIRTSSHDYPHTITFVQDICQIFFEIIVN